MSRGQACWLTDSSSDDKRDRRAKKVLGVLPFGMWRGVVCIAGVHFDNDMMPLLYLRRQLIGATIFNLAGSIPNTGDIMAQKH